MTFIKPNPRKTKSTHINTEQIIYVPAVKNSKFCNNFSVSKLNDEKVVYPPQNPTITNFCRLGERFVFSTTRAAKQPITNEPIIFTTKVP